MENGYDESDAARNTSISLFPECTSIGFEPNGDGTGTITLDFGTGCSLNNGATVSGIIILAYEAIVNDSRVIHYTFDNYFYNGNGVEGGVRFYVN